MSVNISKDLSIENGTGIVEVRNTFIDQGSQILKRELERQVEYLVSVQSKHEFRNIDMLSDNIAAKKNVHKKIKNKISEYCTNIQKIIYATAYYIENENYRNVDEKIINLDLNKFDKSRIDALMSAQKKLTGSFQTLTVVVDVFKRVNEEILSEIGNQDSLSFAQNEKMKLYFKNSVLVYELTNFAINFLESFGLQGIGDIKEIKDQVFEDMARGDEKDKELENSLGKATDDLRQVTLDNIANRSDARNKIRQRWKVIGLKIKELQENTMLAKSFVDQLKIIRQNAANQIDVLNIIITTKVVESTLKAISSISNVSQFQLAPLSGEVACEMLGIDIE